MRKAVVGLGNPGPRYEGTRHNAGFLVVDLLAHRHGLTLDRSRHGALFAELNLPDADLVLVEPQGYMNRSGGPVRAFADELGLGSADVLVVHDELDLPLARTKLKRGGGTAGHRGLESIVQHLGDREFPRLRVGIGRPPEGVEVADFVLTPFTAAERAVLDRGLDAAADAVLAWCRLGVEAAMNLINAARPPDQTPPSPADPKAGPIG